jgi:antitoxin MazE
MLATISKWGNSAALRLPKRILDTLSLQIGDKVDLVQKGTTLVIQPCKPSLDDLLSQITEENKHQEMLSKPAGNER